MQFYCQELSLHIDELGVVDAIIAVEHPADKMRNQVLLEYLILLRI